MGRASEIIGVNAGTNERDSMLILSRTEPLPHRQWPYAVAALRHPSRDRIAVGQIIFWLLAGASALLLAMYAPRIGRAENWPRWRGPGGNAVSSESPLPVKWSTTKGVRWKVHVPGEGASSPIVWRDRVFLTSALDNGLRRVVHCLDVGTGRILWSRKIEDDYPELTSALAGHAAATPATDGRRVIALFGNAGVVCYDLAGNRLWHRLLGDFDSELGLASSPILDRDHVVLVCDHDGDRFSTFDSFLISLSAQTGQTRWKTARHKLYRSWSTPIVVHSGGGQSELIVNGPDELRSYAAGSGQLLWRVRGMTGWVAPSPVFGKGMIFATSGKDGPTMAVRPGGRGDVTEKHVVWKARRAGPYVCSPLLYQDHLYVHNGQGILTCFKAATGQVAYRRRLGGKFTASGVAGDEKVYLTNEAGATFVIQAGAEYRLLAKSALDEECLASPAVSGGALFLRTRSYLYCIGAPAEP